MRWDGPRVEPGEDATGNDKCEATRL